MKLQEKLKKLKTEGYKCDRCGEEILAGSKAHATMGGDVMCDKCNQKWIDGMAKLGGF